MMPWILREQNQWLTDGPMRRGVFRMCIQAVVLNLLVVGLDDPFTGLHIRYLAYQKIFTLQFVRVAKL